MFSSLSGAQWIAMSSQDWSTLTLNISGLYVCALRTAAGRKRSCFVCRVWHVCFHANSHKHRGGCQKCLGGGGGGWEQFALIPASHPAKSLQTANLLSRPDVLVITAEKNSITKKYQPRLWLLNPYLWDHLHHSRLSAECIRCFEPWINNLFRQSSTFLCFLPRAVPEICFEPVRRCCRSRIQEYAVIQRKHAVNCAAHGLSDMCYMAGVYTLWLRVIDQE